MLKVAPCGHFGRRFTLRLAGVRQYEHHGLIQSVFKKPHLLAGSRSRPWASKRTTIALALHSSPDASKRQNRMPLLHQMPPRMLHDVWLRLCENDVDYNDMKHMCKDNNLGGKDMKYNLRAKLIRHTRMLLGKRVWGPEDYTGTQWKRPDEMIMVELREFYAEREVHMPEEVEDAVGLALAMLVVDGVIDQDSVPTPSSYEKLSAGELKEKCRQLGLPTTGNKQELVQRLQDYDTLREKRDLAAKAKEAASRELAAASVNVPPRPPNRALARELASAQASMAAVSGMKLPELRAALLTRNLPVYGTREVLIERMTEVLRQDVIRAHAGLGRMMTYAEAAVAKLSPEEVFDALALRGMVNYSMGEESTSRLANALVEEWIQNSMMGWSEDDDALRNYQAEQYEDDDEFGGGNARELDGFDAAVPGANQSGASSDEGLEAPDPTLDVVLVCGGASLEQRDAALSAARAVLPGLQTDPVWGTLMPPFGTDPIAVAAAAMGADVATGSQLGSADVSPPEDAVGIALLTPLANGVLVTLSLSAPPQPGCTFVVSAEAVDFTDEDEGKEGESGQHKQGTARRIVVEGQDQNVVLQGLQPSAQYEFTAWLRNAGGDGPQSEPYYAASVMRQGVAVKVLYECTTAGPNTEPPTYVPLSWEQLHSCSAAELDARVRCSSTARFQSTKSTTTPAAAPSITAYLPLSLPPAAPLDAFIDSAASVLFPLGPSTAPSTSDTSTSEKPSLPCVTSWRDPEIRRLTASRPAFCKAARDLGYPAADVLELTLDQLGEGTAAANNLETWLRQQDCDPLVTRVAARLEVAGGQVLDAGIGRGIEEILRGAEAMMRAHDHPSVVLEPVHPEAVHFTVSVLGTAGGQPLALAPTEMTYEDVEEELAACDLELRRFIAVQEGVSPAKADAEFALAKDMLKMHPGVLGAPSSPLQRVGQRTPPASLTAEALESIRLAAAKLFTQLGLKDFAQFSGWIVPEDGWHASGVAAAATAVLQHRRREEQGKEEGGGAGDDSLSDERAEDNGDESLQKGANSRPRGKTFAELQAIDEAERRRLADEAAASSFSVADVDKANAMDATVSEEGILEEDAVPIELLRFGVGPRKAVKYGEFAGIPLDDRTRADLLADNPPPPAEPIPEGLPRVDAPNSLPNLEEIDPESICRVQGIFASTPTSSTPTAPENRGTDRRPVRNALIVFNNLSVTPALGSPLSIFSQQAAIAGLSAGTLVRRLVSQAAVRAGFEPLPLRHMHRDGGEVEEEVWPPKATSETAGSGASELGAARQGPTLEEIGKAIESWESPEALPAPYGYDDIASEGLLEMEEQSQPSTTQATLPMGEGSELDERFYQGDLGGEANGQGGIGLYDDNDIQFTDSDEEPALGPDHEIDPEFGGGDSAVEGSSSVLARQYPGLHPTRQRVWVLCGGEGPLRDAGLSAAAQALSVLQEEQDLLVETFFLDPPDAGTRDMERRRTLLQHRLNLLKIGATDDEILREMPEFHPTRVKHPRGPPAQELSWRGVWRLGGGVPLLRATVADLATACAETLTAATTAVVNRRPGDALHHVERVNAAVAGELELAGEPRGGSAPWGGSLALDSRTPHPPQYCFLEDWVTAAASQCVVVLLALPGHPIAQGPLQQLLEARGVPYTGPSSVAADLCADRPELLKYLEEGGQYDGSAVQVPPCHSVSLLELAKQCATEEDADAFFSQLFGAWEDKMLIIRPAKDVGGGLGVVRLRCGQDLRIYAQALMSWADSIPAELLSLESDDVAMPLPPSTQFAIEPFLMATPLELVVVDDDDVEPTKSQSESTQERASPSFSSGAAAGGTGADGSREETTGEGDASTSVSTSSAAASSTNAKAGDALSSQLGWQPDGNAWLEVRACLLGGAGSMRCLGLTTTVVEISKNKATGEEFAVRRTFDVTPPPASVLPPATAADAAFRLQLAADRLGLSGAAIMSALINPAKEEVVLVDVNAHPETALDGLLMRQAAVQPLTAQAPVEVLRDLLKIGMTRGEDSMGMGLGGGLSGANEGGSGSGSGSGSGFFSGDDFGNGEGLLEKMEAPSPTSNYYGDPYMRVEYVSGEE